MKSKIMLFAGFFFLMLTLTFCEKKDIQPTPTLEVSPSTPIAFSAKGESSNATEITVTTNQTTWDAVPSQPWCIVTKDENKFTVTATANLTNTVPIDATITISAGEAKDVIINVTQGAASEASIKAGITNIWTFPEESSDYISLEFGANNTYSLLSKTSFTKTAGNVYLKTGTYTLDATLNVFTLSEFGTIKINTLTEEQMEIEISPTGGTSTTVTTTKQKIAPPTTYEKHIKTIDTQDEIIIYTYDDGKLTNIGSEYPLNDDEPSMSIPLVYTENKVIIEMDAQLAIDKPGKIKITYFLNSNGLATSSTWEYAKTDNAFELYQTTYYTYNSDRGLVSWRQFDPNKKLIAYCNATWSGGNIVKTYDWRFHACNDNYDEIHGYEHDHNQDGIFNIDDIKTFEAETKKYEYTTHINKTNLLFADIDIYEANETLDAVLGQPAGIFGVHSKNLIKGDNTEFRYTMDADGYPERVDVSSDHGFGIDSWYYTITYE